MWTFVERVREKEKERERGRMRELVLVLSLLFSTSKILKQKRKNLTNKKRNLIFSAPTDFKVKIFIFELELFQRKSIFNSFI